MSSYQLMLPGVRSSLVLGLLAVQGTLKSLLQHRSPKASILLCSAFLDSILKSRGIALLTKFHLVKAMVFPVVMYGCESWTILRKLSTEELMLLNCGVGKDS